MALKDEQKEYLSYLTSGRAVMMMPGLSKAIQVQIDKTKENDTERPALSDNILRKRIIDYYIEVYKKGILPGLEKLSEKPSAELVEIYLDYFQPNSNIIKQYYKCIHNRTVSESFVKELKILKKRCDFSSIVHILCCYSHNGEYLIKNPELCNYVEEILNEILEAGESYNVKDYKNYSILDGTLEKGAY